MQITIDTSEPAGAAQPMGNSVSVNAFEKKYAKGILTQKAEIMLCKNDRPDFEYAQKKPLKQK